MTVRWRFSDEATVDFSLFLHSWGKWMGWAGSMLPVHPGPPCPLFSAGCWVMAPAPLGESVMLQTRALPASQPPCQGVDLTGSATTSTQSGLVWFLGEEPGGSVFFWCLWPYPWRSWNFSSSHNHLFQTREDPGQGGKVWRLSQDESSSRHAARGGDTVVLTEGGERTLWVLLSWLPDCTACPSFSPPFLVSLVFPSCALSPKRLP